LPNHVLEGIGLRSLGHPARSLVTIKNVLFRITQHIQTSTKYHIIIIIIISLITKSNSFIKALHNSKESIIGKHWRKKCTSTDDVNRSIDKAGEKYKKNIILKAKITSKTSGV
jgi:hypothetical protein